MSKVFKKLGTVVDVVSILLMCAVSVFLVKYGLVIYHYNKGDNQALYCYVHKT